MKKNFGSGYQIIAQPIIKTKKSILTKTQGTFDAICFDTASEFDTLTPIIQSFTAGSQNVALRFGIDRLCQTD